MTNLTEKLAENARSIGVKTAYGDPVDVDGTSIIPVALVWYGFGAGEGTSEDEGGSGGGGGGTILPIGAYVKTGATARFDPNVISLLIVGIPFVWVTGKALSRIIRALKR